MCGLMSSLNRLRCTCVFQKLACEVHTRLAEGGGGTLCSVLSIKEQPLLYICSKY